LKMVFERGAVTVGSGEGGRKSQGEGKNDTLDRIWDGHTWRLGRKLGGGGRLEAGEYDRQ